MKKILVIGATGQIGSALMTKLRKEYGNDNVVAGYIEGVPLSDELKNGGPLEIADVTNAQQIAAIIDKYKIDSIYNLAAILSAQAEKRPLLASR
jgi:nucleoside-diphosphate-sugar epimerase